MTVDTTAAHIINLLDHLDAVAEKFGNGTAVGHSAQEYARELRCLAIASPIDGPKLDQMVAWVHTFFDDLDDRINEAILEQAEGHAQAEGWYPL
jgi:hypothetical protein